MGEKSGSSQNETPSLEYYDDIILPTNLCEFNVFLESLMCSFIVERGVVDILCMFQQMKTTFGTTGSSPVLAVSILT